MSPNIGNTSRQVVLISVFILRLNTIKKKLVLIRKLSYVTPEPTEVLHEFKLETQIQPFRPDPTGIFESLSQRLTQNIQRYNLD